MATLVQNENEYKVLVAWQGTCPLAGDANFPLDPHADKFDLVYQYTASGLSPKKWQAGAPAFLQNFTELETGHAYYIFLKPGTGSVHVPNLTVAAFEAGDHGRYVDTCELSNLQPISDTLHQNENEYKVLLGWYGQCVDEADSNFALDPHADKFDLIYQYTESGLSPKKWQAGAPAFLQNFTELEQGHAYYIFLKPGTGSVEVPGLITSAFEAGDYGRIINFLDCPSQNPTPTPTPEQTSTPTPVQTSTPTPITPSISVGGLVFDTNKSIDNVTLTVSLANAHHWSYEGDYFAPGSVLVGGIDPPVEQTWIDLMSQYSDYLTGYSMTMLSEKTHGSFQYDPQVIDILSLIAILEADARVEYAEPNWVVQMMGASRGPKVDKERQLRFRPIPNYPGKFIDRKMNNGHFTPQSLGSLGDDDIMTPSITFTHDLGLASIITVYAHDAGHNVLAQDTFVGQLVTGPTISIESIVVDDTRPNANVIVTVAFEHSDHWHYKLNDDAEVMVMSGNTATFMAPEQPLTAVMEASPNTLTVYAVTAGHVHVAQDTDTFWVADITAPTATISGMPTAPIYPTEGLGVVTIGGADVTHYKFKIDSDVDFSSEISVSESLPLAFAGGTPNWSIGTHTLKVIGKDLAENWQDEASPTTATWEVKGCLPSDIEFVMDITEAGSQDHLTELHSFVGFEVGDSIGFKTSEFEEKGMGDMIQLTAQDIGGDRVGFIFLSAIGITEAANPTIYWNLENGDCWKGTLSTTSPQPGGLYQATMELVYSVSLSGEDGVDA